MKSLLRLAGRMRRVAHFDDEAIALRLVEDSIHTAEAHERARHDLACRAMQRRRQCGVPCICIGSSVTSDRGSYSVLLKEDEMRGGGHWLIGGATGSGKSFLVLSLIAQMLRLRPSGICVIDPKGELASLMRQVVIPSIAATQPDTLTHTLLSRIAVVAPFDERATPPFQLLAREPRLPIEVQAHEVATSFGRTIGSDLGVLQQHALLKALMLAIDVGLTIPDVAELLRDQELRRGALERTTLPEVKSYFQTQFSRERGTSVAGLLSRLDSIVMHPSLRRMLRAPGMARFDQLLEHAVTIVDLGGAPAGMSELTRFFGQLVFGKIVRAVFQRQVTDATMPVTIIADEFQQLLMPELARDMERILTLARSQRVFLWAMFQQAAQIDAVSPALLRILRTNTNYQVLMRSDLDDARALAHVLPVTGQTRRDGGRFPDPRTAESTMTADEERRQLVERVPTLPDRVFWFWDRRAQHPTVLTRSPTLDLPAMRQKASHLPDAVRAIANNGVLALNAVEIGRAEAGRLAKLGELRVRVGAHDTTDPLTSPEPELRDDNEVPEASARPSLPTEGGRRRARNRIRLG